MDEKHRVSVTGIIVKHRTFLITKRSLNKKAFPCKWTVPGGNLQLKDYMDLPKDTNIHWYNIFEKVLRREIMEERDVMNIVNDIFELFALWRIGQTPKCNPQVIGQIHARLIALIRILVQRF